MCGGVTALIAIYILGPRKGQFYDEEGNPLPEPVNLPPNNFVLEVLGTFILCTGWYGFNPISALMIYEPGTHNVGGLCAITKMLAAAAGGFSALGFEFCTNLLLTGEMEYDVSMAIHGILGSFVGITYGCSVVTHGIAIIIGLIAGVVYVSALKLLILLKLDDAVDAIPVHCFCGMWGVIAVGPFAEPSRVRNAYVYDASGIFYGGSVSLLGCQILLIMFVISWTVAIMAPLFYVLKKVGLLRVDAVEEEIGLDFSHQKGPAYNITSPDAA